MVIACACLDLEMNNNRSGVSGFSPVGRKLIRSGCSSSSSLHFRVTSLSTLPHFISLFSINFGTWPPIALCHSSLNHGVVPGVSPLVCPNLKPYELVWLLVQVPALSRCSPEPVYFVPLSLLLDSPRHVIVPSMLEHPKPVGSCPGGELFDMKLLSPSGYLRFPALASIPVI
jgi:hypothetical protein